MLLFRQKELLKTYLNQARKTAKSVGFVPTMGALHQGHLSLIERSSADCELTVCSIFINPTQFNDPADLAKYPVTTEHDIMQLAESGADILFLPDQTEIYPEGLDYLPYYEFGYLEEILEGAYRPAHFQGVAQVMNRLLEMVQPDQLFMGQKDYQQCLIVKKLLEITERNTKLVICPTEREEDGLAMSSRNVRLNADARIRATLLHQNLLFIKKNLHTIPFPELYARCRENLFQEGFKVDYIAIAKADDLQLLNEAVDDKMIALVAAAIDEVRLIDNIMLN